MLRVCSGRRLCATLSQNVFRFRSSTTQSLTQNSHSFLPLDKQTVNEQFASFKRSMSLVPDYSSPVNSVSQNPVGASLIPLVNKLQEVLAVVNHSLDLPQIVVVGSQSSGKSSVIENLVGIDFLPRGTGIVTRRPLILQLNQTSSNQEWAEFSHVGDKKFTNFKEVRSEIEAETSRSIKGRQAISSEPIILRIYSPNVLPLTLIDTPGIARVPVGDQPANIEEQVRDMVLTYIKPKNTIILAVQAANQDIATSDAIQLARSIDRDGTRTIGVLTKLDLMDSGTDAMDILEGRVVPLRLGFIGVVNRSQRDINEGKEIRKSLKEEEEFFKRHNVYKSIVQRSGTAYLAARCNLLLTRHIQNVLPEIKMNCLSEIKRIKSELQACGLPLGHGNDKGWILLQMLNSFSNDFGSVVEGRLQNLATSELSGGARIRYIYSDLYSKMISSIDPVNMSMEEYRTALRNASGPRASLFVSEAAFEALVKRPLEKLREPSLHCAELVRNELFRIVTQLENKDMQRFPTLRDKVVDVAQTVLRKKMAGTYDMINNIIDCELSYINTNLAELQAARSSLHNPESTSDSSEYSSLKYKSVEEPPKSKSLFSRIFGGSKDDNADQYQSSGHSNHEPPLEIRITENTPLTTFERNEITVIKKLLGTYFNIVSRNVQDIVIKTIWFFLVTKVKDELHKALVTELYKEQLLDNLLAESPSITAKREILTKQLSALKNAKKLLQEAEFRSDYSEQNPNMVASARTYPLDD